MTHSLGYVVDSIGKDCSSLICMCRTFSFA